VVIVAHQGHAIILEGYPILCRIIDLFPAMTNAVSVVTNAKQLDPSADGSLNDLLRLILAAQGIVCMRMQVLYYGVHSLAISRVPFSLSHFLWAL